MSENPIANPSTKPFRRPTTYLALSLFLLFFLAAGSLLLWFAFCMQHTLPARLPWIAMAALFFVFPARFAFISTRRKLTKGCWLPTEDELSETRAKNLARAQSPKVQRISKAVGVGVGLCAVIAYAFADTRLIHRHGFRSWQMLDNGCLQLFILWAFWRAYRSTQPKSDPPAQP